MSNGTYPEAYPEQPECYRSHQVLINNSYPAVASGSHSFYPRCNYITRPPNLKMVKNDVGLAFSEIHSEFKKVDPQSKPMKKIQEAIDKDIQDLFNVFVELATAHHSIAVAIRILFNTNTSQGGRHSEARKHLKDANSELLLARNGLQRIAEQLMTRAEELNRIAKIPHRWLNLASWFIRDQTPPALAAVGALGTVALNAYSYNSAHDINRTTKTMAATNLVNYPLAMALGFLALLGATYHFVPTLKPYTSENVDAARKAMDYILRGPIPRLMDALGSLDLYWKSLNRGEDAITGSSAKAWLDLAEILDQNVTECHGIILAIKQNSLDVRAPAKYMSAALMGSETVAASHGIVTRTELLPPPPARVRRRDAYNRPL